MPSILGHSQAFDRTTMKSWPCASPLVAHVLIKNGKSDFVAGVTPDQSDNYLESIIDEVEHGES